MLDAAAAAADTWTESAGHPPGWLTTRRQDHPDRVSLAIQEQSRSH